ncbi:fimbrial protein [Atlantibacter subterranea]|uniref:Fimbrial protein n=1 Tax=Atlantibacter subterraneus TaxID=255519 RepID=A0A3R9GMZ0_9ENTR|nr:fimbrial protein [Atlantibacter subterranea]MDA3131344.1 fimbrial protein [Atlantibacter subterranea]MDW2740977.1 fimbrial protein [Atlantibacter subterranea]RSB61045.1 fimbrial protein [Atlantibacter subterranea]RSE05491.1 fimbrial protein [Atlantibacter subterranea]RSE23860.1 fimbrial protein [Atlantibacter subterranea]
MRPVIRRYGYSPLILLTFIVSTSAQAKTDYGGFRDGDVRFYGQVVNAACSVALESRNQVVEMGQVRSNRFRSIGEWQDPHPFRIKLEDCSTNVSQSVGVMFSGETDGKDPLVFQAGFGAGAAEGVGIGISDATGQLLAPNLAPTRYTALQEGETVLSYIARYRATRRDVKAGDASAQVWFSLFYQ